MEKRSLWQFGTREVVYAAIGAALYGVLSWATNFLALPAAGNISLRPAVAIPIFFGIAFGPWVGFLSGFVGNILGDFLSGYGFWWYWSLGNGIMGLIPGLIWLRIKGVRTTTSASKLVCDNTYFCCKKYSFKWNWRSGAELCCGYELC